MYTIKSVRGLFLTVLFCLFISSSITLLSPHAGGVIQLPQTGQTNCYDTVGNVIPCVGTGQDGEYRAGVAWPSPRITDNGDGTVTDNMTGLMWLKDANCIFTQYPSYDTYWSKDGAIPWQPALDFVAGINNVGGTPDVDYFPNCGAGYNDWRLPNINELKILAVNARWSYLYETWLESQVGPYESSTNFESTVFLDGWECWMMTLISSDAGNWNKTQNTFVWPVRAGQLDGNPDPAYPANVWRTGQTNCYDTNANIIPCVGTGQDGEYRAGVAWPSPRFTDNGNGTVTDNLTGLIWLKDAGCLGEQTWANALNSANTLNSGECGLSDGSQEGD